MGFVEVPLGSRIDRDLGEWDEGLAGLAGSAGPLQAGREGSSAGKSSLTMRHHRPGRPTGHQPRSIVPSGPPQALPRPSPYPSTLLHYVTLHPTIAAHESCMSHAERAALFGRVWRETPWMLLGPHNSSTPLPKASFGHSAGGWLASRRELLSCDG